MKEKLLIFKDENINFKQTVYIILLAMILSGVFGFIYETIFYKIDLGYFVKRGSTFGPWIPIYAFGSLFILVTSYRVKKYPVLVFLISCVVTGTLEYITGLVFYEFWRLRLWDYNTEIWNYGNINGYICLRSVLFFGISSLLLIYGMIPIIKKIVLKYKEKWIGIFTIILTVLFSLDIILYGILR